MRLIGYMFMWMFRCRDSVADQSQKQEVPRDRSGTVPTDRCSRILTRQRSCAREAGRGGGEPCLSPLRGREVPNVMETPVWVAGPISIWWRVLAIAPLRLP